MAFLSAAGILLSSFLLVPAFISLSEGKGQLSLDFYNTFSGNILNVFSGLSTGSIGELGFLVLFCGSLIFLGTLLYFTDPAISFREKTGSFLFAVFLILLPYYQPLELVMNGFHPAYNAYYRFTYFIIFYFICLAAREYESVRNIKQERILKCCACCSLLLLFGNYCTGFGRLERIFETILALSLISVLLCIYSLNENQLLSYKKLGQNSLRCMLSVGLIFLVLIELLIDGCQVYNYYSCLDITQYVAQDTNQYAAYVASERKLISQLKQYDNSFYRTAHTKSRGIQTNNLNANYSESLAYNYNSITHYSSTYERSQADLIQQLGYSSLREISINNTRILSSDSLLGVKYMLEETPLPGLQEIPALSAYNGKNTYYNPFALSPAVIYDDTDLAAEYQGNPFEYQNQLFSQLYGSPISVFEKLDISCEQFDNETPFYVPACKENEIIYFYISTSETVNGTVYANDQLLSDYSCWLTPFVLMLPQNTAGDTTVRFTNTGVGSSVIGYEFYALNLSTLKKVTDQLNAAVPENKGWTIRINGQPAADVQTFGGCLYSIGLEPGSNKIEMTYSIPGLKAGMILTFLTLSGYFLICFLCRKRTP